MTSAPRSPAPIRFDLITVFVAMTMWAGLFAAMRLLGFPMRGYILISLMILTAVAARAAFRRFRRPYEVAIVAVVVFVVGCHGVLALWYDLPFFSSVLQVAVLGLFYALGVIIFLDAIFVLSQIVRSFVSRFRA